MLKVGYGIRPADDGGTAVGGPSNGNREESVEGDGVGKLIVDATEGEKDGRKLSRGAGDGM